MIGFVIFTHLFVPETKNKTFQEIARQFSASQPLKADATISETPPAGVIEDGAPVSINCDSPASATTQWEDRPHSSWLIISTSATYWLADLKRVIRTCSTADCTRLNSFLGRCDKLGYTDKHYSDISTMFQEADDALFRSILSNTSHVLHTFCLSGQKQHTHYELGVTINYSFRKLATLTIDTLSLGLSTKTYTDVI